MRLLFLILLALVPTVIVGFSFRGFAELLFSSPILASAMLIVTGFILWFTKYVPCNSGKSDISFTDALLIGLAQGIAVIPGISRSGTTIASALYRRVNREDAATFSFLISVPAIGGAILIETIQGFKCGIGIMNISMAVGALTAFITGYLALKVLLSVVKKGKFHYFSVYCWLVGIMAMMWG